MNDTAQICDASHLDLLNLSDGVIGVDICGSDSSLYDEKLFHLRLKNASGRESVKRVRVMIDSRVVDCEFLMFFPMVEILTLSSKHLVSIVGVERCKTLKRLHIDTGAPNKIDLSKLNETSIDFLRVHGARLSDLAEISRSRVKSLELRSGQMTSVSSLEGLILDDLVLSGLQLDAIGSLDSIGVKNLTVALCRKFEGFTTSISATEVLTVESCAAFRSSTLRHLKRLRLLYLLGCKAPVDIEDIFKVATIEEFVITKCAVSFNSSSLKAPKVLRKIWINPMPAVVAKQISEINDGVRVCNGKVVFHSGKQHDIAFYDER